MPDMTRLDDGFPVIGEIPKCSDILVCKWRVVFTFLSSIILNTL